MRGFHVLMGPAEGVLLTPNLWNLSGVVTSTLLYSPPTQSEHRAKIHVVTFLKSGPFVGVLIRRRPLLFLVPSKGQRDHNLEN